MQPARSQQAAKSAADLILLNGRIYTVNPEQPWAEAVAIRGERIIAVGSNDEVKHAAGAATRYVDLGGRLVLPGLIDSHIHFLSGSHSLSQLDLNDASTPAEIQRRLRDYAAAHPGTGWLIGRGWTYTVFAPSGLPHRKLIDEIVAVRPVLLEAYDGHTTLANTAALKLAGITRDTPDPPNGTIVRDEKGEPTGALKEAASALVDRHVPQPSREENLAALRRGLAQAAALGLTSIVNASGGVDEMELYAELERRGELTLRTCTAMRLRSGMTAADFDAAIAARQRFTSPRVRAGLLKGFVDGVIESHTAAMLEPYSDDPSKKGELNYSPEELHHLVREADRRGLQVMLHAIGDRGVRVALDAFEAAAKSNGTRESRHRVEHIETVCAADAARFGPLGIVASFQPLHAYPDISADGVWPRNVGPQRLQRAFAWRSVANSKARLAFGSDWPVVTLNPFHGIENALTRQTHDGKPEGGWIPRQRLTLEEAIAGYTIDAAWAQHRERDFGSIEPGKYADLVVLTEDLFKIPPQRIHTVRAWLTFLGGKVVFKK
ncbi:MAG: amidohydrolase [Candidatus Acidiferrales bacterium]